MPAKRKPDKRAAERLIEKFRLAGYALAPEQLAEVAVVNQLLRHQSELYEHFLDKAGEPHKQFLDSTCRRRLFLGGNRSGKTATGCYEGARLVRGLHPRWQWPGQQLHLFVASSNLDIVGEALWDKYYSKLIPEAELAEVRKYDHASRFVPHFVELTNGNRITFGAYSQGREAMQGRSYHAIHMDEEAPKDIYEELDKRLLDHGGPWWMTATAVEGSAYLYDLEELAEDPKHNIGLWHVAVFDNLQNLNAAAVDEMLAGMSPEQYAVRVLGQLGNRVGLVYSRWPPCPTAEPTARDQIQPGLPVMRGMDLGWANNTAAVWVAVDQWNNLYVVDEYEGSRKPVGDHAAAIAEIDARHNVVDGVMDRNGWSVTAGVTEPVANQYRRAGVRARPAGNVAHSLLPQIETVWEYMLWAPEKPKLYIARWCSRIRSELHKYRWPSEGDRNVVDKPVDAFNHLLDAMRYVVAERPKYANLRRRMAEGRTLRLPAPPAPDGMIQLRLPKDKQGVKRYG